VPVCIAASSWGATATKRGNPFFLSWGKRVVAAIWHRRPALAELQAMTRGTAIEHLGIEFVEVGDDWIGARMPVDARTIQPYGLLHGGVSVALAETLGSAAAHHCVDDSAFVPVGIQISANHVRGVREGLVHAIARALHPGRTLHVWEIRITNDAGQLVCASNLALSIVPRQSIPG
jgi:1,4-dihydroxy-2-naphthoyl-CoA hydrolase